MDAEHVSTSQLKARCSELIGVVERQRRSLVVTKRGRPVARLVPIEEPAASLFGFARGEVTLSGDIVSPVDVAWEADA